MKSRFSNIFILSLKFKFYPMTPVFDENFLYTNVLYEFFLILMLSSKFAIFPAILVKNNKNIFFVQKWQFSFRPRSAIYWGVNLCPAGRPVALTFKRPIFEKSQTACVKTLQGNEQTKIWSDDCGDQKENFVYGSESRINFRD